ncbi:MAG: protein-glutamate O-methyltransferase CheR [Clostridiales bacterium]|nr:protein-glutamate O-methyltransferase CheR [Clostridiales bacterium]
MGHTAMMSEDEFVRISVFVKSRYGIDMSRKKVIMDGRLENHLRRNGFSNYHEFMDAVEQDKTGETEKALVNLLTTNHTYFMREFEHFEYLRQVILPWLKEKEAAKKDLCIWCGASSTGEEPYTVAMVLLDFFGLEHKEWDTKVLATDVSTGVLKRAVEGIYNKDEVKELPEQWKRRFFRALPDGERYKVVTELKNEVVFRQFNLMDPFPFKRKMHVVFLRNVMIYFDNVTKRELIRKIYDVMEPGGYLFVGQTETIDRNAAPFQMLQPSIFRKWEGMK